MSDRWVLNVNPDSDDVVHLNPREECNIEQAVPCKHCLGGDSAQQNPK